MTRPTMPEGYSVLPYDDADGTAGWWVTAPACPVCRAVNEPCGRTAEGRYASKADAAEAARLWAAFYQASDALNAYQKEHDLEAGNG